MIRFCIKKLITLWNYINNVDVNYHLRRFVDDALLAFI
jgi:hypothetical protein